MDGTVLYGKGSCGSVFGCIRMTEEDIVRASDMDWNRLGKRIVIDPVRRFISWMSPSGQHAILTGAVGDAVRTLHRRTEWDISPNLLDSRWTGDSGSGKFRMEADAAFYTGRNAVLYRKAFDTGDRKEFMASTPPDLVVEVEAFHADRDKPRRWAELGVTEMWRLEKSEPDSGVPDVRFLSLRNECRILPSSVLFPGLKPQTVAQAVYLASAGRDAQMDRFLSSAVRISVPKKTDTDMHGP